MADIVYVKYFTKLTFDKKIRLKPNQ